MSDPEQDALYWQSDAGQKVLASVPVAWKTEEGVPQNVVFNRRKTCWIRKSGAADFALSRHCAAGTINGFYLNWLRQHRPGTTVTLTLAPDGTSVLGCFPSRMPRIVCSAETSAAAIAAAVRACRRKLPIPPEEDEVNE